MQSHQGIQSFKTETNSDRLYIGKTVSVFEKNAKKRSMETFWGILWKASNPLHPKNPKVLAATKIGNTAPPRPIKKPGAPKFALFQKYRPLFSGNHDSFLSRF